jgi:hypothetical protein
MWSLVFGRSDPLEVVEKTAGEMDRFDNHSSGLRYDDMDTFLNMVGKSFKKRL